MKQCRECKSIKSLEEFYKHSKMKDGHLNKCISCVRGRVHRHRRNNLEAIRAYDRARGKTEKRKALQKELGKKYRDRWRPAKREWAEQNRSLIARYNRKYIKENPQERKNSILKWNLKNPEKRKAHRQTYQAIKKGLISKSPCEVCGEAKVEAHHEDYTQPLKVRWLCRKHHGFIHRK